MPDGGPDAEPCPGYREKRSARRRDMHGVRHLRLPDRRAVAGPARGPVTDALTADTRPFGCRVTLAPPGNRFCWSPSMGTLVGQRLLLIFTVCGFVVAYPKQIYHSFPVHNRVDDAVFSANLIGKYPHILLVRSQIRWIGRRRHICNCLVYTLLHA